MINNLTILFKNGYRKLNILIKNNSSISLFLSFSFFVVFFLFLYMFLPVLSSRDDHYFHFRFTEGLLRNGFLESFRDFKTLAFTNVAFGGHLLYYNFLFYLVLIPFTFFTPLYLGIKFFAVVSVSLIGVLLCFFFKKLDIKYPFLWAVGFFSVIGVGTFWRLFLSRPFVLSPIIIILLLLAIHKRKYFWIFFLSFITLFWHTATFLVPLGVGIVYFFSYYFYERKYLWKELLFVFLGTLSSIAVVTIIDAGFINSIKDNLFGVLSSVLDFTSSAKISEGNEVYPKNFFDLFNDNIFLCVIFLFSSVVYIFGILKDIKENNGLSFLSKEKKILALTLFLMSSIFFIAIPNISNRFTDFFIFFSWLFAVLIIGNLFSDFGFKNLNLNKYFKYSIFVCLIYLFFNNGLQLNDMLASSGNRPDTFKMVGSYISENLKEDEVVFDVNWSFFPQLYYYAPKQNYVIGIEPKLMYVHNPKLYWLWQNISYGYVCDKEKCLEKENEQKIVFKQKKLFEKWSKREGDQIAEIVLRDFRSRYIVSSGDFYYLNSVLDNNKNFKKVVNDTNNKLFVYKIVK